MAPRGAAAVLLLLLLLGRAAGVRAPDAGALLEEAARAPGRAVLARAASALRPRVTPRLAARAPWRSYSAQSPAHGVQSWLFGAHGKVGVNGALDMDIITPEESAETMATVRAAPLEPAEEPKSMQLPAEWVRKLDGVDYRSFSELRGRDELLLGRVAGSTDYGVAIWRWRAADPATTRHFRIHDMLADLPFVAKTFERRAFGEWAFTLLQPRTHRPLSALILEHEPDWNTYREPLVPLSQALPLMIDILAGFKEINARGVVIADLHHDTVSLSAEGTHMWLDDFRYAGVELSSDPQVSCGGIALPGRPVVPPCHLAPETQGDAAARLSSNQWHLGLIFAHMLLGANPVEQLVFRMHGSIDYSSDEGRALIREATRRHFFVWEMRGFHDLMVDYSDVLKIVSGLLEKDPNIRWTAEEAWREAVKVAEARGIPIDGGPRLPQTLPREWYD